MARLIGDKVFRDRLPDLCDIAHPSKPLRRQRAVQAPHKDRGVASGSKFLVAAPAGTRLGMKAKETMRRDSSHREDNDTELVEKDPRIKFDRQSSFIRGNDIDLAT